ncbi:MAG: hypothetical protein MHM6MM_001254 [Cercozoa sp. M6MM]
MSSPSESASVKARVQTPDSKATDEPEDKELCALRALDLLSRQALPRLPASSIGRHGLPPILARLADVETLDSEKKRGSSCHQCKLHRDEHELLFCNRLNHHETGGKRRCRKKYCLSCLRQYYGVTMAQRKFAAARTAQKERKPVLWTCIACEGKCRCARCQRARGNEADIEQVVSSKRGAASTASPRSAESTQVDEEPQVKRRRTHSSPSSSASLAVPRLAVAQGIGVRQQQQLTAAQHLSLLSAPKHLPAHFSEPFMSAFFGDNLAKARPLLIRAVSASEVACRAMAITQSSLNDLQQYLSEDASSSMLRKVIMGKLERQTQALNATRAETSESVQQAACSPAVQQSSIPSRQSVPNNAQSSTKTDESVQNKEPLLSPVSLTLRNAAVPLI